MVSGLLELCQEYETYHSSHSAGFVCSDNLQETGLQ